MIKEFKKYRISFIYTCILISSLFSIKLNSIDEQVDPLEYYPTKGMTLKEMQKSFKYLGKRCEAEALNRLTCALPRIRINKVNSREKFGIECVVLCKDQFREYVREQYEKEKQGYLSRFCLQEGEVKASYCKENYPASWSNFFRVNKWRFHYRGRIGVSYFPKLNYSASASASVVPQLFYDALIRHDVDPEKIILANANNSYFVKKNVLAFVSPYQSKATFYDYYCQELSVLGFKMQSNKELAAYYVTNHEAKHLNNENTHSAPLNKIALDMLNETPFIVSLLFARKVINSCRKSKQQEELRATVESTLFDPKAVDSTEFFYNCSTSEPLSDVSGDGIHPSAKQACSWMKAIKEAQQREGLR